MDDVITNGQTSTLTNGMNAKIDEVADSAQRAVGELSRKASQMTEQASATISNATEEVKNRTTRKMDDAVKGINNVALYVNDWQKKDMNAQLETVATTVRRHPIATLAGGLIVGWLVGRILK